MRRLLGVFGILTRAPNPVTLYPWQQAHFSSLLGVLQRRGAALDASDTGTGKTVVALAICKALDTVPLVLGPKNARGSWEDMSESMGIPVQFVNYDMIKPRRRKVRDAEGNFIKGPDTVNEVTGQVTKGEDLWETFSEFTVVKPWGKGSFVRWKNDYDSIIFDEGHRCGGTTSIQSKLMIAAKRQARLVLVLSATAADDPRQMKALGFVLGLHGLHRKSRLVPDWVGWMWRHGIKPGVFGGHEFDDDPEKQKEAFRKMHTEIFPRNGSRMVKSEIPGFPETTIDVRYLTDETGKAKQLAADLGLSNQASDMTTSMGLRQQLEILKVPHLVDMTLDYALTSKVVIFVNFTEPLEMLRDELRGHFGFGKVGFISGANKGDERLRFIHQMQRNELDVLVVNSQAGSESMNAHDLSGQVERTALINPVQSGRVFKQLIGRVHRQGGAKSLQLIPLFKGTDEEPVGNRMRQKAFNVDLLNDGDFAV